jgi:glycerol-3-phosphate dehydrogenase (NAD(P)+)
VEASILLADDRAKRGYLVPLVAIAPGIGETRGYVFKFDAEGGVVRKTPIKSDGSISGNLGGISEGVAAGDIVAAAGVSLLRDGQRVAWATKGFELATGKLPHEVADEVLGPEVPTAVLSGPTFAREVGAGLPSAMTVASRDEAYALELARSISGENFRAYASGDMTGVEVGGAVKNVLAIGAGISDGLGFGANTRVALITRGLAEMMRLGVALGAERETFMGLAGLGDLVLTCTDDQSRNRRCGLGLAAGKTAEQVQAEIGQVVEGVLAARAVHDVAQRLGVEMPISEQVYQVLYEARSARQAVYALMGRTIRSETD